MIPGQLGPTRRDFDWLLSAFMTYATRRSEAQHDLRDCTYLDLILLRYSLSYADNQTNFILDGFDDGIGSGGWWDVEHGSVRLYLPDGLWQD